MFNAEHLQEKWAPLLNAEGVDHAGADVSGSMAGYLNTLRGLSK